MIYAADFETTTNPEDCRVWAWGVCPIHKNKFIAGNNIETFIEYIKEKGGTYYFHNLKFDGMFIIDYLLRHQFKHTTGKKLYPFELSTLISDMGAWYSIRICFEEREVEIRDSLKILPMTIAEMPKNFDIPLQKLEIDYEEDRPIGHVLTDQEKSYLYNDVMILAEAIHFLYEQGQKKLTTGSNAMKDYKERITPKQYDRLFPRLEPMTYDDIKRSYKGGFTYLNPKYKNKIIENGTVFDVNSMYPWAMKYCCLPYGDPIFCKGKVEVTELYPLFVQSLCCEFKLKPGRIPSIQIKNNISYRETEYLEHSEGLTQLVLTSVDLQLFFDNYDVYVESWDGGYQFSGKVGMFDSYIDHWYELKNQSKKDGKPGLNRLSKLMLNSLYGKFGARRKGYSKIPYLDEETDKVRFTKGEIEERKAGYIPVATFITSYCRDRIIRGAIACGERFIYADTDSLHIVGDEVPDGLDVDDYRLGAFKVEERFTNAKFIRQKTYMELVSGKWDIKCAGMPKEVKKKVYFEDFKEGAEWDGKLLPMVVPGGVILKNTTFQIKKS